MKEKRPRVLPSSSTKMITGCGNLYVTEGTLAEKTFEIFAILGHAGECPRCFLEALTRCVSLGLQHGIPIVEYIEELKDLQCPNPMYSDGNKTQSCPDAIAQVLSARQKME